MTSINVSTPANGIVRATTVIPAPRLAEYLGVKMEIVSETFQHTGSFKFRAAYHLASHVPNSLIIASSSGNFGQALAMACSVLKKNCIVVMPDNSAKVKIDAVRNFGGVVELIDLVKISRATRVDELAKDYPEAYIASAYDDPLIIEGNSSLGVEISKLAVDTVVVPIGGGGLASGIITGLRNGDRNVQVFGAEPSIANDAARSLKAGYIVSNEAEPPTIADGARTLRVGRNNWPILRDGLREVLEVSESQIIEAVNLLFSLANLKVEPTGALAVGALLAKPEAFRGRQVCCVISGGNVDNVVFRSILLDSPPCITAAK